MFVMISVYENAGMYFNACLGECMAHLQVIGVWGICYTVCEDLVLQSG